MWSSILFTKKSIYWPHSRSDREYEETGSEEEVEGQEALEQVAAEEGLVTSEAKQNGKYFVTKCHDAP